MKKTIFVKLIGTYFVIILLCIGLVGISLSFMFRNYLYNQKETELIVKGKDIVELVKPMLVNKQDPHNLINLINRSDLNLGTEVWVTDKKGLVIAAAANHEYCEGNALEDSEVKDMQSGKISVSKGLSQYYQEPVIRVTLPVMDKNKVIGAIIVYSPILGISKAFNYITKMIIYAGLISLVIAILVGIFLSKRISDPILRMALATIAIAKGEKKVEVNTNTGLEEINQLGKTLNYMSSRIEENENRMKDFVANVSHELRSPLTSIKGFTEALLDNKDKGEEGRRKYLTIINKETNRLSKLVNDLLVMSKAERNNMDANSFELLDVYEVIIQFLTNLKGLAREKFITIEVEETENLPLVKFDANALRQIILNLIENSIKYSPELSKINIFFRDENENIRILIKDEGVGIPKEDLTHIWDRFYRVDKARSRETGGTGLGLSIVKQLVEKNNGTVDVESIQGKGSTFSFTTPKAYF